MPHHDAPTKKQQDDIEAEKWRRQQKENKDLENYLTNQKQNLS